MAARLDDQVTRPILSNHNGYHAQMSTSQPSFPEHLGDMRPTVPPVPEHHGLGTPFDPPIVENNVVLVPYYEGYTIRPDDLASSEDRWSLPPKKLIPATQEDLHAEVITQRQSGRTACRQLEDCHGPKRQYIDRLIGERNASTSLGYFEVAQLRLERIPRDSGKASSRTGARNHHARDYKQKDLTKTRQKTVYMHIILQLIKSPNRGFGESPQNSLAPRDPNVGNSHPSLRPHGTDEDNSMPLMSSDDQSPVSFETSQRPFLARGCTYTARREQTVLLQSSRYISRSTQTTLSADTRPHNDRCSDESTDEGSLEDAHAIDTWTTTSNVDEESPISAPPSHDETISMDDSAAALRMGGESIEEQVRDLNVYEKPPWFQNMQPVRSPGVADERSDICDQQDDRESSDTHEEKDTDGTRGSHDEEGVECVQPDISSCFQENIGQRDPDTIVGHMEHDGHDQSRCYTESEGVSITEDVRKRDSVDKHTGSAVMERPMSENFPVLPGPAPPGKLPPSERYKPRPSLNWVPARPSLTRAAATYDSRPTDDSDRKSSKRVSFQQIATPLYTPPSTTASSPVSPSASPQLPFRTIFTKPPPVSIPPGHYTPIASSSPVSPISPLAARKPYTCLEPTCNSSFDHLYDRDSHERQHEIGDPPYSQCPVCHHSRSSGAAVEVGLRDMLIAHINRRHWGDVNIVTRPNGLKAERSLVNFPKGVTGKGDAAVND